jgi:hypothetical protein
MPNTAGRPPAVVIIARYVLHFAVELLLSVALAHPHSVFALWRSLSTPFPSLTGR